MRSRRGSVRHGSAPRITRRSSPRSSTTPRCRSSTPAATCGPSARAETRCWPRSEWGTSRMSAGEITKTALEQRTITVTDELDDGRRVVNAVETAAAQDKANMLQERFSEWCWEDPDRAARLLAEYNRRFNSIVLRDYSAGGRAAESARPGAQLPAPRAPACCGRADHRRARRRAVSPGRRREDRDDRDRRQRAAPPRARQKARRRRPEPHARAIRARVAADQSAGADPRRLIPGPRRRETPPVRRTRRQPRLGRDHPHPLRVRTHPRHPRNPSALHGARTRASCARCSPTPRPPAAG